MIALNLESYVFFREIFNKIKESIQLVLTAFLYTFPTFSISTRLLTSWFTASYSSSLSSLQSEKYV